MPRNAKDSDDEFEAKSGRRTRAALNPSVLDSPLRRSSRIKHPVQQEGSSPDSVSDVSSTSATRSSKRKTTTADAGVTEPVKNTRTRRLSVASDISELTETESLPDGPPKRVTRRSVANVTAVETPPGLNGRTRRATRAGSESKSTPPVGRTTRRNRASSLEPEAMEEQTTREVGTPAKSRRRASVMPSEPAVAEESEDTGRVGRRSATKTVYEVDENATDSQTLNTSMSSRRKSKNESIEIMEVDESPVGESEANTIEISTREKTEAAADVSVKLEDSAEKLESPENKRAEAGSSQQLSSPTRGSTYTIQSLLSPTTEKQEKSPGNKENENRNNSASLLEKTTRSSNRSDVRFSTRHSMGSTHVKTQEKRLNLSVDDNLLSNDFEIPTKSQEEVNTETEKKSTPKVTRRERYSVDDCVVIIEPMERNQIDKFVNPKTAETPKTHEIHQIEEITSEVTVIKEIECILPDKEVKNTENYIINKDDANQETNFEISNVVSIVSEEKEEKMYEPEPMDVDESPDTFYLTLEDANEVNEEKTENDEEVSVESSSINTQSQNSISENEGASEVVNDDKTSTEISISNPEPQISDSNEKSAGDCFNDEKMSAEPSVSKDELKIANLEEKVPKAGVEDENASSEPSVSNDAVQILNPEEKITEEGVNDGKTCLEHADTNEEPRASNPEEQTVIDEANDETTSLKQLVSNTEESASNSTNATLNKRESPTAGANVEEATEVSEEKRRKSTSNASEDQKKNDDTKEKSSENEVAAEGKTAAHQSDDESEYDASQAFKDIPADEWTEKKNPDPETSSLHSVSTERNGSEFDFVLVDKESTEISEKDNQAKSDCDSDDNFKVTAASKKSPETKVDGKVDSSATSEETPMCVSSDGEDIDNKVNNSFSTKYDLDTSRKIKEAKSPNKNVSSIADSPAKPSPIGANSSRRKSRLSVDNEQSNDNLNSSVKLNSSVNKSLKKKSLNASARSEEGNKSDDGGEADTTEVVKTPKINTRKSLDASAKKSKNTPDSSKTIGSAKNTPSNAEKNANETSSKRKRSLAKSAVSDDDENSFDNTAGSDPTMEGNETVNMSKHAQQVALETQLKAQSPGKYFTDILSSANNSPASGKIEKRRSSLNKSEKIGSAKKSPKNKNVPKPEEVPSDADDVEEESQQVVVTPKGQLNESRKSLSAKKSTIDKNKWTPTTANVMKSDLESPASPEPREQGLDKFSRMTPIRIPLVSEKSDNVYAFSPASPALEDRGLNTSSTVMRADDSADEAPSDAAENQADTDSDSEKMLLSTSPKVGCAQILEVAKISAKIDRAKKWVNGSPELSSDSMADDENSPENLNESKKSKSSRKSVIDKNYSTIAQVNSDSPEDVESESSDCDANISRKIPSFIFSRNTDSDNSDSSKSIDSDVQRDMNLHGKSVLEYSDDDVPADDCMATEPESSDDDDDGADLIDFVVDDDEEEEHFSDDLSLAKEESHESRNGDGEKKPRKRIIPRPARESDSEDSEEEEEEKVQESSSVEEKTPRKRIIPRPARESDSTDSEEEPPTNVSSRLDKSNTSKTPIKPGKLNKTQEIVDTDGKHVDLNVSAKNIANKNKNQLIQCSTPKTIGKQSLDSEQSDSTKATTPLNKSAKLTDSSVKNDVTSSKKLSKSVCETIQTPAKLASSFKFTKTPKTSLAIHEQLQTSLPADLNETAGRTNLSKAKSTKLSTLNQTVVPSSSESPETRFLMKQKLNDSMPALKLQQKAKALRRSVLDNLREGIQATEAVPEENDENEVAEEQMSISKEETEVSSAKKKKNRGSANPDEFCITFIENLTPLKDEPNTSIKATKKLKKQKLVETLDKEETKPEELTKKKKKKHEGVVENVVSDEADKKGKKKKIKHEEIIENVVLDKADKKERKKKNKHEEIIENVVLDGPDNKERKKKKKHEVIAEKIVSDEVDKKERKRKKHEEIIETIELDESDKKKKKKNPKLGESAEPEVPASRQKSKRLAAQNVHDSDSDEPEMIDFAVARDAALKDFKKIAESIKAAQEAKKKKHQEKLASKLERNAKTRPDVAGTSDKIKTSVKRLSDDILSNLSDVVERPNKRRKVNKEEVGTTKKTVSTLQAKSGNFQVDDGYIPLSSVGGTTQFTVVNLKKAVKHSKKSVAASTFRERMLNRNPRQPISAYLMYQQKQKHSAGADRNY